MVIVMKFLKGLGIFIGLVAVYLIIIVFFPVLKVEEQPIQLKNIKTDAPPGREDVTFKVDDSTVKGWLYLPANTAKPVPCIVLSHGFCGTKDMLLERYALRFAKAGYAALIFDYRHFGDSQGEPRQLYSIPKQLEDIKAAIKFARSRSEVDPEKIAIWGTSASGSYGIMISAEDKKIAAVIGQAASLDHELDGNMIVERDGIGWLLKLIVHAQRDKGRSRFGLSPHRYPAVGKPGTTALHLAPGAYEGYEKIAKNSKTFKNEICARILFDSHGPDLFESAEKVSCPVLLHVCEKDNLIAPGSHEKIEKIMGKRVRIVKYPIGHFDIYFGENFNKGVKDQIAFLKKNL